MIELYRAPESDLADRAEEALRELVVIHRVYLVDHPDDGPGGELPVVCDGDRVVVPAEIPGYLDELRLFMASWRRFQSDACYVGDDGQPC